MIREQIDRETMAICIGCVQLDVDMARAFGWTENDIKQIWTQIHDACRAKSKEVALRAGYTRECPHCECWTVPEGPCHLCTGMP